MPPQPSTNDFGLDPHGELIESKLRFNRFVVITSIHENEDVTRLVGPGSASRVEERPERLNLLDGPIDYAIEDGRRIGPEVDVARARTGLCNSVLHSGSEEDGKMSSNVLTTVTNIQTRHLHAPSSADPYHTRTGRGRIWRVSACRIRITA